VVILLFPALFYFSTSIEPEVVIPVVVGGKLSVAISEPSPATVRSETQKIKHERPENLSASASASSNTTTTTTTIIYSHARRDRSGAALHDMLMAHAYAWQRNWSYAGACISTDYPAPYADQLRKLLQATGLHSILQFACPETDMDVDMDTQQRGGGRIVAQKLYHKKDTSIWTAEWRRYIRSRLRPAFVQTATTKNDSDEHTIAMHIRRGDCYSPCETDEDVAKRYLPNQHYLRLLDHYYDAPARSRTRAGTTSLQEQQQQQQQRSQVVVYSESESFESWKDFRSACSRQHDHNCTLRLDTNVLEVWRGLLTADTLVLSKSSMSLVAGLLSSAAVVIYTPFWHEPLKYWTVITKELEWETRRELERMKRDNCSSSVDER
jgi:hypothetical protein